jgi:hypothetical protein
LSPMRLSARQLRMQPLKPGGDVMTTLCPMARDITTSSRKRGLTATVPLSQEIDN